MDIRNILTDIKISKELKEVGVKYKTYHFWLYYKQNGTFELLSKDMSGSSFTKGPWSVYPAFTAQDLLEVLKYKCDKIVFKFNEIFNRWNVFVRTKGINCRESLCTDKDLIKAISNAVIFVHKEGDHAR